nr:crotonase/enoyl-CoA hydratase family protein [Amycolatopsis jejuensis]
MEIGGNGAVLAEKRGAVVLITLNRPEVRNAVNPDVCVGIGEALDLADQDGEVRAVILTGAGDRAFCAGADLKAVARDEFARLDPQVRGWGFAGFTRHFIGKPVIAAVNGYALGGGTELVLQADLAIAAEGARFGLPEVTNGVVAGAGGAFRLGRQIPPKVAMEILLTGEMVTAHRALALGLVNDVVPDGEVVPAALALAGRIAANAPLAVQASRRIARGISEGQAPQEDGDWVRTAAETAVVARSADLHEGLRAFAEKRAPVWSGR